MKQAVIVVDMLNDFITGALKCDRGVAIVPQTVKLVDGARKANIPVIFTNDAHIDNVDHELKHWGVHAMAGTTGATVIPELKVGDKDYVITKRRFSAFFHTDLELLLRELGVDTLIVVGLQTHICVQHTVADAYYLGYDVKVPKDATDCFTQEIYDYTIKYLADIYGAEITDVDTLLKSWKVK